MIRRTKNVEVWFEIDDEFGDLVIHLPQDKTLEFGNETTNKAEKVMEVLEPWREE